MNQKGRDFSSVRISTLSILAIPTLVLILILSSVSIRTQQANGTNTQNIVIQEYLESDASGNIVHSGSSINLIGHWNTDIHPLLHVSLVTSNLSNSYEIASAARIAIMSSNIINLAPSMSNSYGNHSYESWNMLLEEMKSKHVPILKLDSGNTNSNQRPEIKVTLTDKNHTTRFGETLVTVTNRGEILSANITIYSASKLYQKDLVVPVIKHELGHALGLAHSNDERSIMYPSLTLIGGLSIGQVGDCEYSGISALYLKSQLNQQDCLHQNGSG